MRLSNQIKTETQLYTAYKKPTWNINMQVGYKQDNKKRHNILTLNQRRLGGLYSY